ncbi:uncharacterized protein NECHADRAFT_83909 [Fusarium vanettenii 77-13-4]|uniref:Uncharacterized protein n=1 Tax=Fusarium vanettenii (strain ATCC MYA-4622 / CBS 123669 / FGSC 9596 / NRRL 45880 / 77-13-4) TaxID=660122 RepID=C7YZ49_FUSV7|nr:uncharacterized protein NECHADRAFT_83909 [Fusarium vanettenii 77-13-4]EEU43305.1 hypothetical protein NECHADRAFT_83909 [Fusarium vanettenii 77-13-4]
METISNAAAAAAKAVWGENQPQKEPVSGVQGDTAKGEPYDAGNLDTPAQEKAEQNYNERTLGQEASAAPKTARVETPSGEAAAFGAQSKDARDTSAGQNDTRNPERVGLEKEKNTDLEDVDNTSEGNTAKLGEGPGPRPVEVVAKELGGDAGRERPQEGSSEAPREIGSEGAAATSSSKSENQPDPARDEVVHATGFAADGGDFDATKPGAGREAERLMEEKGVHLGEEPSSSSHSHKSHEKHSHDDKHKDKPSLGERIKAKLHKH